MARRLTFQWHKHEPRCRCLYVELTYESGRRVRLGHTCRLHKEPRAQ